MARPIRPGRSTPKDGRSWHGHSPTEFVAYADNDGRADPATCEHPIFLDHVQNLTALCMECGHEIVGLSKLVNGVSWKLAVAGQAEEYGSSIKPSLYTPEAVLLDDTEIGLHRHRWHAIWGLDGWTATGPMNEDLVPPARLKGKMSGIPSARPVKNISNPH